MGLQVALAMLLSGGIGISLGLLGGGGSILAMPVLVYVAGVAPRQAVGMSLAIVGATSLLGGLLHRRNGRVDLRVAATFGATGIAGALLGARLTHLVPESMLLLLFAALMLIIGTWMLLDARRKAGKQAARPDAAPPRSRLHLTLLAGLVVGALTGFLGVGGGFLIVPALLLFTRLNMRQAVGTSLIVIALNSVSGFIGHLGDGGIDLVETVAFTAAAAGGAFLGHRIASRSAPEQLRRGFASFVILVGCFIAARA